MEIPDIQIPSFTLTSSFAPSKISIDWPEPAKVSCVCLVVSPGSTWREVIWTKEKIGMYLNTDEKCHAIIRAFAEFLQGSGWTSVEGLGKITNQSSDLNFQSFVNNLYDLVIRGKDD
jgi:hypothetical protein